MFKVKYSLFSFKRKTIKRIICENYTPNGVVVVVVVVLNTETTAVAVTEVFVLFVKELHIFFKYILFCINNYIYE
jgi:hypothetical protein